MTSRAPRKATLADLEAVPEGSTGEILDGELVVQPRPAAPHLRSATALTGELSGPFDRGRGGPGGWVLLAEPELHLGADVVVPDLAGWRRGRMPELPDAPFFTLAPDWVCEVLSPRTARFDRVRKPRIYGRESVTWYWLVDPVEETLEILRWTGDAYVVAATHEGEDVVRAPPFEAIELELAVLWRR